MKNVAAKKLLFKHYFKEEKDFYVLKDELPSSPIPLLALLIKKEYEEIVFNRKDFFSYLEKFSGSIPKNENLIFLIDFPLLEYYLGEDGETCIYSRKSEEDFEYFVANVYKTEKSLTITCEKLSDSKASKIGQKVIINQKLKTRKNEKEN